MATTVTIATLPAASGSAPHSVDMTLTATQAQKLNQITQGLKADSAQLAGSGSVIVNHKDALKFLIETAAVP
ncbi:MAG: hypothetical protein IIA66_13380 [Planctomycetes bacterium]|nr:hypothetical protein [Planctomycetota bacterium]